MNFYFAEPEITRISHDPFDDSLIFGDFEVVPC
jgi:hypothetical protein